METIIVAAIVLLAAAGLICVLHRRAGNSSGCGCEGCGQDGETGRCNPDMTDMNATNCSHKPAR